MKHASSPSQKLSNKKPPLQFVSDPMPIKVDLPKGSLLIDLEKLRHAPSVYVPLWYQDQKFKCRDCGVTEIWTAAQQKHFCEEQKGNPNAKAIRCRACRERVNREKRTRKEQQEVNREAKLRKRSM